MAGRIRGPVLLLIFAYLPLAAAAQTIPSSEQPGTERQRFEDLPAPKATPARSIVVLPSSVAPEGAAAITLVLRNVSVDGATIYSQQELAATWADFVGREVSLASLYEIARRITARYGEDGYVLSRAILPPQELDPAGAAVRIQVIEGFVDRVEWPPELAGYRDLFSYYASRMTDERPVNVRTIERYLLLASDLPGLTFRSSLRPSSDVTGASTLVVEVIEKPITVTARADNRGTEARGPYEFLTSLSLDNRLGIHERLTATYAAAFAMGELHYAALSYEQVLNGEGLKAFTHASFSWGDPGTDALQALDFHSESLYVDAGLSYPLIRRRDKNLTLSGELFLSNDEGDILAEPSSRDRLRGVRVKTAFDAADESGGLWQLLAAFSQGIDGLGSTGNDNSQASREAGRVDFTKIELFLAHTRPLGSNLSFYVAADGQLALTPLLAPEECGYGGRTIGRGFDPAEITGDHCLTVIGELRYDLPALSEAMSQLQLYGFADHGDIFRIDPAAGTPERDDGSSLGVGLRLGWNALRADVSIARPIGRDNDDWRVFFVASASH